MASIEETTFGFVGCGTMSSAVVRGLCTLSSPPRAVVVSPRNAEKAAALAKSFPKLVTVAASNQAVVDSSDVVFIGVLPKITEETCRSLKFTSKHTVVSLVSTSPMVGLREWCAPVPAESVVRAIPLPPVAHHAGSCIITPKHALTTKVFDSLGTAVAVDSESELQRMMPVSCIMGQIYKQQATVQDWLVEQGIDRLAAARWVGAVFHTVTFDAAKPSENTFNELVAEQTPGGLNEQVIGEMVEAGAYTAIETCLDGCLARIQGKERPAKRQKKN